MAYTYEKQLWKDYPDTTTPVTAERLNHMEDGISEAAKNGGGESDKIGVIKMFGGSTAPDGWLICDGSLISRTEYSGLFNVIGTSYNLETDTDDTKFRLPNLKGRVPVGLDSEDTDFNTLGKTGGEKTHTLTVNEIPSHSHNATVAGKTAWGGQSSKAFEGGGSGYAPSGGVAGIDISKTGEDKPHNNMQPYIVLNYIIKASQTAVLKGNVVDNLTDNSTENAPSKRAVNEEFIKVKGKILWTNPNPTTAISSSTDITLLNDDYDVLEIFYRITTSKNMILSAKVIKGWDSRLIAIKQEGTGLYRELIYNNDTSYTLNIGSAESVQCIPLYIVGYKTGLFTNVITRNKTIIRT